MKYLRLPALALLLIAATVTPADDKQEKTPPGAAILKMTPEQLLKLWDKNKDGFVDKSEAPPQVQQYFDQLDQNSDGKLDQKELGQLLEILKKRRLTENARQGKAKGKNNGGGIDIERAIDALLTRLDANKDRKISRSEAAGRPLAQAFERLDTNKDGYLDRSELAIWVQRIGNAGAKKGGMAQKAAQLSVKSNAFDFDALDKDADGRLTPDELKGTGWADLFDKIDTNKDGKIERKEFEAYLKRSDESAKSAGPKSEKSKQN